MTKDYSKYSREKLLEEIKSLHKRTKYGIVWEEKQEDVVEQCKKELPVLEEVVTKAVLKNKDLPTNLLIEGDNYHALSVLNYTHSGKIDVIYIDPPYNTGARDWKYNNNYVDINDTFRHSKWLSFMEKRLNSARNLLKSTGIIVVTVDDYEIAPLKLLMNEIFGPENHLGTVVIRNNPSGRSTVKGFSVNHEYAFFYSLTDNASLGRLPHNETQKNRYKEKDDNGYYEWENFRKNGTDSNRYDRPKQFFPIIINTLTNKLRIPKLKWNSEKKNYDLFENLLESEIVILPINNGIEKVWKYGIDRTSIIISEILVKKNKIGFDLYRKKYLNKVGSLPRTWWNNPEYSARDNGTRTLNEIFGPKNHFDFPKAPQAVEDCIRVANLPYDGTILDFFAGSGTTGHAVLKLNAEDGGRRKFILCTNNENNIAEEVTYARIKAVIKGYGNVKGIAANLRYFKTTFVPKSKVSDDTRRELVKKSVEMICVKENTFERIVDKAPFKVFRDSSHTTGILFDLDLLNVFKDELKKHGLPANIYVFSLTNDTFDEDFEDLELKHELCPIPESILEVYKKLFSEI